jgi:hypothetical protein
VKKDKQKPVFFIPKWYPSRFDDMLGIFVQRHAQAVSEYENVIVLFAKADPTVRKAQVTVSQSQHVHEYSAQYPSRVTGIGIVDKLIKLIYYFSKSFGCLYFLKHHSLCFSNWELINGILGARKYPVRLANKMGMK